MNDMFIDGVTVICSVEGFKWWILIIILGICFGILSMLFGICNCEFSISFAVAVLFISLSLLIGFHLKGYEDKEVYKVTIAEDVSYTEFIENYVVLKEEDGVYTILLK